MYKELNRNSFFTKAIKWILIIALIGGIAGTGAAILLSSLDWATKFRENHLWMIAFLPVAGLVSGLLYYYFGKEIADGNKIIINAIHLPKVNIPVLMAPLIYTSTLLTHLFGGSAGRESTAVQITAGLTNQFRNHFSLSEEDRKIFLLAAIAAGFGAVFGTPIAGVVYALEFSLIKKFNPRIVLVLTSSSLLGDYIAKLLNTKHTLFTINVFPVFGLMEFIWVIIAGIAFGCGAILFSFCKQKMAIVFKKFIPYTPLQPMIGGFIIVITVYFMGATKYLGLGIPTIAAAFETLIPCQDFILKMAFTILTLSAGFKGGETTPLFFIGATLGNCLSIFIPLPFALLAGMGFVAIFSGVMKTPLAGAIMAVELFGVHAGLYASIVCAIVFALVSIQKKHLMKIL